MDTDTSAEKMLQDVHAGREVIYSLLYRSFIMTPDEDYYRMLESLLSNMFPTTKGAEQIEQFLRERISATDKAEYDLETQREYTRLFCMTNSVRTCQSHYESDNKLSREAPYDECLALYAAYEFPVDESHSEDADFIAEQLRFMSYMASLSNEAAGNDIEKHNHYILAQINFIDRHLQWLESFDTELRKYHEAERLYLPLSTYMLSFISADRYFLQGIA